MALRLKPETREAWMRWQESYKPPAADWRPVPRAEPAPEKDTPANTFDVYSKTWVDT